MEFQLAAPDVVRIGFVVVLVCLAGGLVYAAFALRSMRRRLNRLDDVASRLAQGELETPIPFDLGTDVVGRIGAHFEMSRRRLSSTLRLSRTRAAIATELNSAQPLRTSLQRICAIVRTVTGANAVTIVVAASPAGDAFAVGHEGRPFVEWTSLVHSGPSAAALSNANDHPVHLGELDPQQAAACNARFGLAVPIRLATTVLGAVLITDSDTNVLRHDAEIAVSAAEQVALALERYRILAVVESQANTDDLTGLHNHRFLIDFLGQQVALAQRRQDPLTVLMCDLDHFKQLNDTYGHQAGDLALEMFASVLASSIRRSDLAARYGGEEFVVVMPNTTATEALVVAEKIRAGVEELEVQRGASEASFHFTVSIGMASFPEDTQSGQSLIRRADEALYTAKHEGRNRVVGSTTTELVAMSKRRSGHAQVGGRNDG